MTLSLAVMILTANASAQTNANGGFWRPGPQVTPNILGAENDPHNSLRQTCDILSRWTTNRIDRIDGNIVRTLEAGYVLAINADANATFCLRFDPRSR